MNKTKIYYMHDIGESLKFWKEETPQENFDEFDLLEDEIVRTIIDARVKQLIEMMKNRYHYYEFIEYDEES